MGKTLTISIAAYNVENYIRQTLDSLIDESIIDDLEILVIDDGGTDRTLEIAKEFAERYPQSVIPVHKENGGYGSTINTGIELATGKYFKQLDGDDWYQTEGLKELIKLMKTSSADCILTDCIRYNEVTNQQTYINMYPYMKDGEYQIKTSGLHDRLSMYMSAFRTEILKSMQNRLTEHCFYTDIEYSALPIQHLESIYVLHTAIYVYRIGADGQSMNRSGIAKHYLEHESVFWRLVDIYANIPGEQDVNKKIFKCLLETRLKEHYQFMFLLPEMASSKKEIIKFTRKAQEDCPDILDSVSKRSRMVRAMKHHMFFTMRLFRYRVKRKWENEGRQLQKSQTLS